MAIATTVMASPLFTMVYGRVHDPRASASRSM
jgi:hypothetical protein